MSPPASTSRSISSLCSCIQRSASSLLRHRPPFKRSLHKLPSIPNLPYDLDAGIEPFLSGRALQGTAVEWHQGCLDRLNDLSRGTKYENQSVSQTVIQAAKAREDALLFGYASEALNNGFFLSCLTPKASDAPIQITEAIKSVFGSVTSFINHFSSYASGMFGSGYVWLVMDSVNNMAVLATYGSGTILVQGAKLKYPEVDKFVTLREERQGPKEDANRDSRTTSASIQGIGQAGRNQNSQGPRQNQAASLPSSSSPSTYQQATRKFHTLQSLRAPNFAFPSQEQASRTTMGYMPVGDQPEATRFPRRSDARRFVDIHPLLCLSLHPHVYIPDYGIWGKERYIQNFWRNVDWERLERRWDEARRAMSTLRVSSTASFRDKMSTYAGMSSRPVTDALNIWDYKR